MLGGTLHPKGHTGLHVWLQGPKQPSVCVGITRSVGPTHRVSVRSPASGHRPPLPCMDRVASPPTVRPPPPGHGRGSSRVPRPSRRSHHHPLCAAVLATGPGRGVWCGLGRGHREPKAPGLVWHWGPQNLQSLRCYRQPFRALGVPPRTWAETRPVSIRTRPEGSFLMGTQTSSQSQEVGGSPVNGWLKGCEELVRPHAQAGPPTCREQPVPTAEASEHVVCLRD